MNFKTLFLLGVALVASGGAHAHTRSVSYSSWDLDEKGASVRLRIPLLQLSRLAFDPVGDTGSGGAAARYLAAHLTLRVGDAPCPPTSAPQAERAPEGWAHFAWRCECSQPGERTLRSEVLLAVAPSHMHFARLSSRASPLASVRERVLTEGDNQWQVDSPAGAPGAGAGTTLAGYLALGIEHIVTGWDHLAFVLALLLLAGGLREVAGLVSAFTVAHSITLGLAVLGWLQPDAAAVEALIGYSIALVAAENAWLLGGRGSWVPLTFALGTAALAVPAAAGRGVVGPIVLGGLALFTACHFALLDRMARPARLRAAVAFAFGLVHGFGFAGVLAQMDLPRSRLVPALFGFNVGVELGQLAVVALFWPLLAWVARGSPNRWQPRVAEWGSAAICGLGLFWFVTRSYAG